jgi:hypothetical protein
MNLKLIYIVSKVNPNILWQHYLIPIVETEIYIKTGHSFKI